MSENTKPDGGAAFPVASAGGSTLNIGMTLRDYFAAKAMAAIVQNPAEHHDATARPEHWAMFAYQMADAMIAERSK